jgi:hypothetical protein
VRRLRQLGAQKERRHLNEKDQALRRVKRRKKKMQRMPLKLRIMTLQKKLRMPIWR